MTIQTSKYIKLSLFISKNLNLESESTDNSLTNDKD
jgi:hypothetical protein